MHSYEMIGFKMIYNETAILAKQKPVARPSNSNWNFNDMDRKMSNLQLDYYTSSKYLQMVHRAIPFYLILWLIHHAKCLFLYTLALFHSFPFFSYLDFPGPSIRNPYGEIMFDGAKGMATLWSGRYNICICCRYIAAIDHQPK